MSSIELSRFRAHLKLLINRLRFLQRKKIVQAKLSRRSLAQVIEDKKIENARIRIENIIHDDIYVELLAALEMYAELVLARCATLHGPEISDPRLKEALTVLLYSSQHTDIKELNTLKICIAHFTSKDFVLQAAVDKDSIPEKIQRKLHIEIPSAALVDQYLLEIAKAYSISVPGIYEPPAENEAKSNDRNVGVDEKKENDTYTNDENSTDDIWARFAALKK